MNRRGFVSLYLIAAGVLLALFFLWGIARNWSCRQPRHPREPRIVTAGPFDVLRVESGVSLVVKVGLRRRQEQSIILSGVEAPTSPQWAESSRANLENLAGTAITISYEKHGIFRDAPTSRQDGVAEESEVLPDDEGFEARGPLTGVVKANGVNLNKVQVEAGLVTCATDAPVDLKVAEKVAKKSKLGIWQKVK